MQNQSSSHTQNPPSGRGGFLSLSFSHLEFFVVGLRSVKISVTKVPENIENYRGPGFLAVVLFGSFPAPSPLSSQQVVSLSRSSCVSKFELTEGKGEGGGGTARKPGPLLIIQYSLLVTIDQTKSRSRLQYFMSFCRILSTLCSHVVFHNVPHFSRGRQKSGTKSTSYNRRSGTKCNPPSTFCPALLKSAKNIVNKVIYPVLYCPLFPTKIC